MSDAPEGFAFRLAVEADRAFIVRSWLKCAEPCHRDVRKNDYYEHYHRAVTRVIESATVLVVCDVDEPHVIAGFAVFDADAKWLLYVHVKETFRKGGLATAMMSEAGFDASWIVGSLTCDWQWRWKQRHDARYVPWEVLR